MLAPFHFTAEPATKFLPFTVRVKADCPAIFHLGEMKVVMGLGLLTVTVWALEVPPPGAGLVTVTLAVPAEAMSDAGMEAVSLVADT